MRLSQATETGNAATVRLPGRLRYRVSSTLNFDGGSGTRLPNLILQGAVSPMLLVMARGTSLSTLLTGMVARRCGLFPSPTLATLSSRLPHLRHKSPRTVEMDNVSNSRCFAGCASEHPDHAVFLDDSEPFQDEPIVTVEEPRAQLLAYNHKKTALLLPPTCLSRFSCELIMIRPCALRIANSPLTGPGWPRSVHSAMFHSQASQTPDPTVTQVLPDHGAPWLGHDECVDENEWKFDKNATAFAQQLIATEWESPKEGLAVLPLQTSVLGDKPRSGPQLVTRQCVRELWEEVFKQLSDNYTTKVAIIGNPGIGKSRNLIYGLRLLLGGSRPEGETRAPQGEVIIFECRKEGRVFAFVPPGRDVRGTGVNNQYCVYTVSFRRFTASECVALRTTCVTKEAQD